MVQLLLFFNQMLEFGLSMGMQSCFVSMYLDYLPKVCLVTLRRTGVTAAALGSEPFYCSSHDPYTSVGVSLSISV